MRGPGHPWEGGRLLGIHTAPGRLPGSQVPETSAKFPFSAPQCQPEPVVPMETEPCDTLLCSGHRHSHALHFFSQPVRSNSQIHGGREWPELLTH